MLRRTGAASCRLRASSSQRPASSEKLHDAGGDRDRGGDDTRDGHAARIAASAGAHRRRDGSDRLDLLELEPRIADRTQPLARIFLETAAQQPADRRRRALRKRLPVRLGLEHGGEHLRHVVAVERAGAGQHLVEDDAEGPDVGAPVDRLAARLLGRHVGGGADNRPHLRCALGEGRGLQDVVGAVRERPVEPVGVPAPSRGRSRAPSPCRRGAPSCSPGFRSRWTMPCSCAASSASAICRAIGSASASGTGPRSMIADRSSPATSSITSARTAACPEPVEGLSSSPWICAMFGMIQRRERLRFAREAREPIGIVREQLRQHLDRDVAIESRVAGAEDLAHAADADGAADLVHAQSCAWRNCQGAGIIARRIPQAVVRGPRSASTDGRLRAHHHQEI